MKQKIFETERLVLKPTTEVDAKFILNLFNTPEWIKYIGNRNLKTIKDSINYINTKMKPQLELLGFSNYTVIRKEDNEKIGTCGLYDREGISGIDIGFAFLKEFEKKGYAFEATNKIKNVAFNEFNIEVLKAVTKKNNISSQKLLEKIGIELNGTTTLPDSNEEILLYELKKTGYNKV